MNGNNNISSKQVIAKLTEMGFENSNAVEAVKVVGPSVDDAVEYMLNGCRRNSHTATSSSISTNPAKIMKSSDQKRQSTILEHFQSINKANRVVTGVVEQRKEPYSGDDYCVKRSSGSIPVYCLDELDIGADWEQKVNCLLQKQFGYLSLKGFQREALTAWLARQDCLVLAATGSGKYYLLTFVSASLLLYDCIWWNAGPYGQLPFGREVFVFPDSGIVDRKGCGCDIAANKPDA